MARRDIAHLDSTRRAADDISSTRRESPVEGLEHVVGERRGHGLVFLATETQPRDGRL